MIVALILYLVTISIYIIIVGGNKNKSVEERKIEDEEQMKYLKKYRK